jgi:glycosyltransferase involved in cell wall biosynthesis
MKPNESSDPAHDVAGLRIVQVIATTTGGTGAHVRVLVEHLTAQGATVTVCGPAETDRQFGYSDADVRFVTTPIGSNPHPRDLRSVQQLKSVVQDADLVHAHSLRAAALTGLATPKSVPIVVTRHNAILVTGLTRRIHEALQTYTARRATVTLCVSGDLVDAVRQAGGEDVRRTFITAPPMPPPRRDRDEVRASLDVGNRPLILAVGRLHPQKDHATLIRAAGRISELSPRPLVAIAGGGPQLEELAALIARTQAPVRLLGNRDDVPDLLAAADVLASASEWEGCPLAVQEGLRAGLPFVGTRVGSVPDIVADAGLLVPPHDVRALAAQLQRVLTENGLAKDLADRAVRRAGELPDDDEVVGQAVAAYADALRIRSP